MRVSLSYLFPHTVMPSQPDFEAAHRLNPARFPADPNKQLIKEQAAINYLAEKIAKKDGRKREEVIAEAYAAAGEKPNDSIQIAAPKNDDEKKGSDGANDAKPFFGNKNGTKFYPIAMRQKPPYTKMKEENIVYFNTAEDAAAQGYESGEK